MYNAKCWDFGDFIGEENGAFQFLKASHISHFKLFNLHGAQYQMGECVFNILGKGKMKYHLLDW